MSSIEPKLVQEYKFDLKSPKKLIYSYDNDILIAFHKSTRERNKHLLYLIS